MEWNKVVARALEEYVHRDDRAYLYGTDGQIGSDELVEKMVSYYPAHFISAAKNYNMTFEEFIIKLKDHVRGKKCYDCSGWIHHLFDAPDMASSSIIADAEDITTPPAGPAGNVLHKTGHIGIDIGYGHFLHMPYELRSIELGKISEYDWQRSGSWKKYADYSGADAR